MTASGLAPGTIHYVVVPEFGGLAHLPDDPAELLTQSGGLDGCAAEWF
jgi:hypothetical protein